VARRAVIWQSPGWPGWEPGTAAAAPGHGGPRPSPTQRRAASLDCALLSGPAESLVGESPDLPRRSDEEVCRPPSRIRLGLPGRASWCPTGPTHPTELSQRGVLPCRPDLAGARSMARGPARGMAWHAVSRVHPVWPGIATRHSSLPQPNRVACTHDSRLRCRQRTTSCPKGAQVTGQAHPISLLQLLGRGRGPSAEICAAAAAGRYRTR
jgi:hypothetical protein